MLGYKNVQCRKLQLVTNESFSLAAIIPLYQVPPGSYGRERDRESWTLDETAVHRVCHTWFHAETKNRAPYE